MKKYKFLLLALGLFVLAACNNSESYQLSVISYQLEEPGVAVDAVVEIYESNYVLVTDFLGREVLVPRNPRYVASIYAPTAQLVAMLGGADTIVAMANGNTRDVLFMEMLPFLDQARLPRGGGIDINMEELFADPVPQLILLDAVNVSDRRIMDNLALFGVPVLAIEYFSIEGLKNMVAMLGEILGTQDRAAAYINYFQETIDMIQARVAHIPMEERPVVYHAVNEILRTNIVNSLSGEIIPLVGVVPATNAVSDDVLGNDRHIISLEQLLIYDPQHIIITGADVYDFIFSPRGERLHVMQAYRYGNIHLLPMGVTRWGHHNSIEAPLAMKWMAQALHPTLFYDIDIEQAIKDFYLTFFDFELSDEFVEMILDGRTFRDWRAFRRD